MTLEAFNITEITPTPAASESEILLLRREMARRELGRTGILVVQANKAHLEAITELMAINEEISVKGIDYSEHITQTQQPSLFYDDIHGHNTATDQDDLGYDRAS